MNNLPPIRSWKWVNWSALRTIQVVSIRKNILKMSSTLFGGFYFYPVTAVSENVMHLIMFSISSNKSVAIFSTSINDITFSLCTYPKGIIQNEKYSGILVATYICSQMELKPEYWMFPLFFKWLFNIQINIQTSYSDDDISCLLLPK